MSGRAREEPGAEIRIPAAGVRLAGDLTVPHGASAVVLFAHGSGSSRFSPRNRFVAAQLREGGLGTLLIDLLTEQEDEIDRVTRELRFDIPRLADRVGALVDWLRAAPETEHLQIGLFGASTGAAAALIAAADRPAAVAAVVSRGGRPDLAGARLPEVRAPTLLVVGSRDEPVIGVNRAAQAHMTCPTELVLVEGATHLFEEPGTLDQVATLARDWFLRHTQARS